MERAVWRLRKILTYPGKRPAKVGDMMGPVAIMRGATIKTTVKYMSFWRAS